jgi:hypothetical protein
MAIREVCCAFSNPAHLQASIEEAQMARVMQASLESEREQRARLESLRLAEQELMERGIEASVDISLVPGRGR